VRNAKAWANGPGNKSIKIQALKARNTRAQGSASKSHSSVPRWRRFDKYF